MSDSFHFNSKVSVKWGQLHPNAAQVFMDYIMSRDGQVAWHSTGETASPLTDIPGSLQASTIDAFDPNLYPPKVEKKFREEWTRNFK